MNTLKILGAFLFAGAIDVTVFSFARGDSKVISSSNFEAQVEIPVVSASMMEILPVEIDLPEMPDLSTLQESIQQDIEKEIQEEAEAAEAAQKAAALDAARKAEAAEKARKAETAKDQEVQKKSAPKPTTTKSSSQKTTPAPSAKPQGASKAQINSYAASVQQKIARTKQRRDGEPGNVVISITIAPSGALSGIGVAKSSGNASTDQAALSHVKRSAPFGKTPDGNTQKFNIPVKVQ